MDTLQVIFRALTRRGWRWHRGNKPQSHAVWQVWAAQKALLPLASYRFVGEDRAVFMSRWNLLICLTMLVGGMVACKVQPAPSAVPPAVASTNLQYFQVKGVVQEVKPANKSVVIKHEEVPNYMPAMTMP